MLKRVTFALLLTLAAGLLGVGGVGPTGAPADAEAAGSVAVSGVDDLRADQRVGSSRPPIGPGVRGWRLTKRNIGLARFGLSCDELPVYGGPARPKSGARIVGKLVTRPLDLSNGGIKVKRSCIRPTTTGYHNSFLVTTTRCDPHCSAPERGRVVIVDSEISGFGMEAEEIATSCGFLGVGTLRRTLIRGMGSGICFFETGLRVSALAEQNYVTDLRAWGDSHNEAATVRDFRGENSDRSVVFRNNRLAIYLDGHTSGGLFIQPTWESIYHLDVVGNLLEGIGFNLFLTGTLEGESGEYDDLRAINNRFLAAGYGPAAVDEGPGWDVWRDNHLYDPDRPGARGRLVRAP